MNQDTKTTRKPLSIFKVSTRESLKNKLIDILMYLSRYLVLKICELKFYDV